MPPRLAGERKIRKQGDVASGRKVRVARCVFEGKCHGYDSGRHTGSLSKDYAFTDLAEGLRAHNLVSCDLG